LRCTNVNALDLGCASRPQRAKRRAWCREHSCTRHDYRNCGDSEKEANLRDKTRRWHGVRPVYSDRFDGSEQNANVGIVSTLALRDEAVMNTLA
jgi:hypothetical protein